MGKTLDIKEQNLAQKTFLAESTIWETFISVYTIKVELKKRIRHFCT